MMRVLRINKEDGIALVLTLMAVSFLVAVTVQLATSVNWQMQGASNLKDSVMLDAVNISGLSLVRAALLADQEENKFDSYFDLWNTIGKEDAPTPFAPGRLKVSVTDLSGRLQVNALVPEEKDKEKFEALQKKQIEIWKRLLTSGKFAIENADQAVELIDAIIDWIDEDDNERDHGAESGYYLSLSPAYPIRNAPVTSIDEMLFIRGMTKELFYGNEQYSALSGMITVAGRDGKININTAPAEVLMALDLNMTEEIAQDLLDFRGEETNKDTLAAPGWYTQVSGALNFDKDLVDIKSRYFEISVEARQNEMVRNSRGIIERDTEKQWQKLLYWEVR